MLLYVESSPTFTSSVVAFFPAKGYVGNASPALMRSVFVVLFLPMASPAQTSAPVLERTFEVGSGEHCRLRIPRASVSLLAGAEGEARVTITAAPDTTHEAAQAYAEKLQVRHVEGVLRVEPGLSTGMQARDWRVLREGPPALDVQVHVPADFGADIHASGGTIEARGLRGAVTLEATGGTIRTSRLSGRLYLHARRCRTVIEQFDGKKCKMQIHGGTFTMHGATADTIDLECSAVRLHLHDIDGRLQLAAHHGVTDLSGLKGELDAEVCGGDVWLAPEAGCPVHLHAPGSTVCLRLPQPLSADLLLSAHQLEPGPLDGFEGERTPHQFRGRLGGGGAPLEAAAPGGSLRWEAL